MAIQIHITCGRLAGVGVGDMVGCSRVMVVMLTGGGSWVVRWCVDEGVESGIVD